MKRILSLITLLAVTLTINAQDEPTVFKISDESFVSNDIRNNVEQNMFEMFKSFQTSIITSKNLALPKKGLTKSAINDINMLWECSEFICPLLFVEESLIKTPNGWEVRNVPVNMLSYDKDAEKELVISFDTRGTISGVDIAIGTKVYNRIMAEGNGDQIDMARRQQITNFIEIFRTAYNKKDLKYLEQVYSDDALIITGRVVKQQQKSAIEQQKVYGERIEYVKHTKETYLENLRRAFARSRYINVKFSDIEVVQHTKYPDIYGVTLRQDWRTQGYQDDGFVFLMIDFCDENHPEIHVRTWQPAVKNGRELSREEIFGIGSFNIGGK